MVLDSEMGCVRLFRRARGMIYRCSDIDFDFVIHTFRYPSEVIAHKTRQYDRDQF